MSTIIAAAEALRVARPRLLDYLELTKPRISVMALFTVAAGVLLAFDGQTDWILLLNTLIGAGLVAAGASALNQLFERDCDACMLRTEQRPLPTGRLLPWEVLVFGATLGLGGIVYLAIVLRQPLAAALAAATLLSYVFLYTPLKRHTTLNTLIGAVPGALPPVIGYAAVRGMIDFDIVLVFTILFLWQVPHFLAIAWIYREDYARAGFCMLPVIDREGVITGRQMVGYCIALVPASLAPLAFGRGGVIYLAGALILGFSFLVCALAFANQRSLHRARIVLRASLIYLPSLLALLLVDTRG